jgi:hypothetical protein
MKTGDTLRRSDGKEYTVRDVGLLQHARVGETLVCHVIVAPDGAEDQIEAHSMNADGNVFVSMLYGHIYTLYVQRDTLPPPSPTLSDMRMQAVADETIHAYENATVCAGCMTALWRADSCPVCEEV